MTTFKEISKNRYRRQILNRVLKGGCNASSFILLTVAELGKIAFESFHPQNYSFTRLGRYLLGLPLKESNWKQKTLVNKMNLLISKGLVVKDKKCKKYYLSVKGQKIADDVNDYFLAVNKKWDGIFRVVIFDVPERKKEYRNWLRNNLYSLNFKQLQKSVFIGKQALPLSFIQEISHLKLDDFVHIFNIREIDSREEITKSFKHD
ncbi:MAG: PaaX family transcriptional regulator [Parcubacteria group bacterium GW2011_GWA2_43_9b]|uniref:Transcriptional repressor PaaX-like central Cas2-like domain-containing protein n=1 Tax=Candidatus Portnoybacteria bacterium RIFCSPLOWO2_02_FULL_39_11 TaxID=1802001 RepID=A0A1G2FNM3_9BACT|nr:MAG: PaaX family transcriptional regulator [Parcubacteria group bacterium GW2011_GWA2_43_9b]OGZ39665.1 MAG: hypothetical protein A3B04_01440 [Candidatus Portnoybacteria bacterium RIFCSPLOWO2_02_FULL_39_11]